MIACVCVLRGRRCRIRRKCRTAAGANDNCVDEIACLLAELAPVFQP
jgi:hypothetical protein